MINAILNGIALNDFIGYLIWSIVGGLVGILTEQYKFTNRIKTNGGFSILTWINENWRRTLASFLIMIIGIIFQKEITGLEPNNYLALMAGFSIDTAVDRFINKKKH